MLYAFYFSVFIVPFDGLAVQIFLVDWDFFLTFAIIFGRGGLRPLLPG